MVGTGSETDTYKTYPTQHTTGYLDNLYKINAEYIWCCNIYATTKKFNWNDWDEFIYV